MKHCMYCEREIDTQTKDGWLYALDQDLDKINFAHIECAEVCDDLIIERTSFET